MSRSTSLSRFAFVDALRGVAAMSVVVFHIYKQNLLRHAERPFPEPFHSLFVNGYLGVYIFFVLSGFVIAHSVRGYRITPGFVGRFALRRSLRLDPPYWAAIAAAIVIAVTANQAVGDTQHIPVPSATDVIAHVFYLQGFLHVPNILGVFWTLCLEIQFYLIYVVLLGVTQRLADRRIFVFGPLFVLSIVLGSGAVFWGRALCLWAWPFFFAGVITSWHLDGKVSTGTWGLVLLATCACGFDDVARVTVAIATASALLVASLVQGKGGRSWLEELSLGRVLQYLGRISYSLYLTHLLVGSKSARFVIRLLGKRELGYPDMIAILLGCIAISLVAAHVMYVLVEKTSVKLSKRVRLEPQRP